MYISKPECDKCGTKHFLNQPCPVLSVNNPVNKVDSVSKYVNKPVSKCVNKIDCTAGDAEWEKVTGYLMLSKAARRRAYMKDYMRIKRQGATP